MSGIGISSLYIAVNRAKKKLVLTGLNWFRDTLNVQISGFAPSTAETLVMLGYRGDTLVTTAQGFTGAVIAAGIMDTNTTELDEFMGDVKYGYIRPIDLFIWDSQTLDLVGRGSLDMVGSHVYSSPVPTPVHPVTGSTVIWGNLAMYGGATYVKSGTDGLWYPFNLNGTGATVTESIGTTGIIIPED